MRNMKTISSLSKKATFIIAFLLMVFGKVMADGIQTTFTVSGNEVTVKMKSNIPVSGTFTDFKCSFRYLDSYNLGFTVTSSNYSPVIVETEDVDPNDPSYAIQDFDFTGGGTAATLVPGIEYSVFTFTVTSSQESNIIGLCMDEPYEQTNSYYAFNIFNDYTEYVTPFYGALTNEDFIVLVGSFGGDQEDWMWRTNEVYTGKSWLTTGSTDWNTMTNWSDGAVPLSSENLRIYPGGNQPIISTGAVCNNLDVLAGANVQIDESGSLSVDGNLVVADDNAFVLKSSGLGTGSLIVNGTVPSGNEVKVERYIPSANWSLGTDGWHLLSSPIVNQAISGAFTPSGVGNDYDFYAWSEPTQQWLNQKVGANGITSFDVGLGYLVAYESADTKEFVGTINNTDKPLVLTNNGVGNYGWNLLGNPYPSALIWATDWTMTNIGAVAQVWSDVAKDYTEINPGDPIPAMNGFMVYTSEASQGLTIPAAKRAHNTTSWYKSAGQQIKLIARDPEGASFKTSIVRFDPNATEGFDLNCDAYMLSGFAPKFYSIVDNSSFTVNTLTEASSGLTIPFGFAKNASTNFSIDLAESLDGYIIYLRDLKTNTVVNLSEKTSYSFTSEEGDDVKRFELFFGVLGVDKFKALATANVYNVDDKIIVANVSGKTMMDITNVQGQLLNNFEFFSTGNHEISVNLPTGIYMVRLSNSGEMKTMKVFVK